MIFPFLYNNAKSKVLIKMIGKVGLNNLLLVLGITSLVSGVLFICDECKNLNLNN